MTSATTVAGAEAALLEEIYAVLDRIDRTTTALHTAVTGELHLLPAPLRDGVANAWDGFCEFLARVWRNLGEIVSNMGSPSALWDTADR